MKSLLCPNNQNAPASIQKWCFLKTNIDKFKTSKLQNFKTSKLQNFKTSKLQNFKTSKKIAHFYQTYYIQRKEKIP
jgi:hypothetical protein